jgi:hypothetical protein
LSPITHFLHGWALAQFLEDRRDRAIVTIAAVIPDLDGFGVVPELLTRNSPHPLLFSGFRLPSLTHAQPIGGVVYECLCSSSRAPKVRNGTLGARQLSSASTRRSLGFARSGWIFVADQVPISLFSTRVELVWPMATRVLAKPDGHTQPAGNCRSRCGRKEKVAGGNALGER